MKGRPPLAPPLPADAPPYARLIRAARLARDWSQADLEEHSGLSKMQVYRADRGLHVPSHPTARALRDALGIPHEVMDAALAGEGDVVDVYITSLGIDSAGEAAARAAEAGR